MKSEKCCLLNLLKYNKKIRKLCVLNIRIYLPLYQILEKNKIKKLYGVKCLSLKNGISKKILKFKKKKYFNFKYIIYSGSINIYQINLQLIFLVKNLMPKLLKKPSYLKLVLTGGGYNEKYNFLVNVGTVSKQKTFKLDFKF